MEIQLLNVPVTYTLMFLRTLRKIIKILLKITDKYSCEMYIDN